MKIIEFVCDRCGKRIDDNGIYTISPEALDKDGETTKSIPDDVYDELCDIMEEKHLCLGCLKKTLKFFGAPAVPNPVFEKAVPRVHKKPENNTDVDNTPVATITEDELRNMIEKQGMTVKQVCDKTGLGDKAVYYRMKKAGIKAPRKASEQTEPQGEPAEKDIAKSPVMKLLTVEAVKEAYFSGKNIPEVSEQFGVSIVEMRRFMLKNRISKASKEYDGYLIQHGRINTAGF